MGTGVLAVYQPYSFIRAYIRNGYNRAVGNSKIAEKVDGSMYCGTDTFVLFGYSSMTHLQVLIAQGLLMWRND